MCPRALIPLTPNPAHTPNPTLPLGPRGDHRDPRTGLLSKHADEGFYPVSGHSRGGQKIWRKRMERGENAASRWTGLRARGLEGGEMEAEGMRGRVRNVVAMREGGVRAVGGGALLLACAGPRDPGGDPT